MSQLSDGLQYVSFELMADTDAAITSPENFLTEWNEAVRLLADLTGTVPGAHANRPQAKLIFREVSDNDPEVLDGQFAVWSAGQGIIKINRAYQQRFIDAANASPLVLEMAEALGGASLAYQYQDPTSPGSAQVIGSGRIARGFGRALGLYPMQQRGTVSSVWTPGRFLSFDEALNRELVRCYRKLRMGFAGDDYLGLTNQTVPDADVAYGFFTEVFIAYSTWALVGEFLQNAVPAMMGEIGIFDRGVLEQYDDLIFRLSETLRGNLRSVLYTWKFSRDDALDLLPEGMSHMGSSRPIILSERMRLAIDPEVAAREDNAIRLPGITLGGADALAIGQSGGPVLVLTEAAPVDGISYRGKKARLLGCFESNGIPVEVELRYNLGEVGFNPYTLVVPVGPVAGWDLEEEVVLTPGSGQELWYARVLGFGEAQAPYMVEVTRWDGEREFTQTLEIPLETYAIIASSSLGYDYVNVTGTQAAQIITKETVPQDKFKDATTGEITETPAGKVTTYRTVFTFLNPDGTTTRSFASVSNIMDATDNILARMITTTPATLDPTFYPTRERPVSEGRARADVLKPLANPVLVEQMGFSTRLLSSQLAVAAGVTVQLSGFHTEENVRAFLKSTLPTEPVRVVDLPNTFVETLRNLRGDVPGATAAAKDVYRFKAFSQAVNNLPAKVKEQLSTARAEVPLTMPALFRAQGFRIPGDETLDAPTAVRSVASTRTPRPADGASDAEWQAYYAAVKAKAEDLRFAIARSNREFFQQAAEERENQRRNPVTQIRNFLNNGVAGLAATNGDPNNALSYLDGSFMDNVMGSFDLNLSGRAGSTTIPNTFGVLNASGNPRAIAGVLGGLTGAAVALIPGGGAVAPVLQKSVEQNLVAIATQDKPPKQVVIDVVRDLSTGIVDNLFKGDRVATNNAHRIVDFLADLATDWYNGSIMGHDVHDALHVTVNSNSMDLSKPLSGTSQEVDYINFMLGFDGDFELSRDPRVVEVMRTPYGDFPIFDNELNPRFRVTPTETEDLDWVSALFGKNLMSIVTGGIQMDRKNRVDQHLQKLRKEDAANAASLQNYRASLVQQVSIHKAKETFRKTVGSSSKSSNDALDELKKSLSQLVTWEVNESGGGGGDVFESGTVHQINVPGAIPSYVVTDRRERTVPAFTAALEKAKQGLANGESDVFSGWNGAIIHAYLEAEERVESLNKLREHYERIGKLENHSLFKKGIDLFDDKLAKAIREDNEQNLLSENLMMTARAYIQEEKGETYFFEVMPAVRSVVSTQGMQAPGADRGIAFRSSLNIAKLNVPGSSPVYQVMGINEETVEFVGAFLGMGSQTSQRLRQGSQFEDVPQLDPSGSGLAFGGVKQHFRAQQESEMIRNMQLRGSRLTLHIESFNGSVPPTSANDFGIKVEVKGYIAQFERMIQRDDRVWYRIMFRIVEHNVLDGTAGGRSGNQGQVNTVKTSDRVVPKPTAEGAVAKTTAPKTQPTQAPQKATKPPTTSGPSRKTPKTDKPKKTVVPVDQVPKKIVKPRGTTDRTTVPN